MAQRDTIVVVNAGSSSIKFSLYAQQDDELHCYLKGQVENLYGGAAHFVAVGAGTAQPVLGEHSWEGQPLGHDRAMRFIVEFVQSHLGEHQIGAIGHRIVHGGQHFDAPARLTPSVLAQLEQLTPLAPLHQPHNLAPVRTVLELAPALLQVACFDTAFHAGQPALAQAYALPAAITGRGVRRYGFHGLSYEYISSRLPALDSQLAHGRVVVAHLGNGASMCALANGRSLASTMGFTALDGLPMGTRCGNLDPGVLLFLMDELQMDARAIEKLLYQQSGLLGVSGISADMRTLERSDDPRARLAIDLFAYRIGRELGSLAAALGGLDALVFTGGIGEHSVSLRAAVCRSARWLGLQLDELANANGVSRISGDGSAVSAWVLSTNEELMIAEHTRVLLAQTAGRQA